MSAQTLFYVLGLALTALALIVSFAGLRMERFPPSRGMLAGVIGAFVVLVLGAAAYAWISAEEEQEHRDELIAAGELLSPAEVMEEMAAAASEQEAEAGGETAPAQEAADETASADGAALFDSIGCGGCHSLEAAGTEGTVGPNLDVELVDQDVAYIEESIVDPDAELAKGFSGGIMPDDYEQELSPEELDALVEFLADAVGAKQ